MALIRISATIPADLVKTADRRARELARSRSWVIAEALRAYLGVRPSRGAAAVREEVLAPDGGGGARLGEHRRAQLETDLRLTPEKRVLEAERTAALAGELERRRGRSAWLRVFDRYEDYLEWKRLGDLVL